MAFSLSDGVSSVQLGSAGIGTGGWPDNAQEIVSASPKYQLTAKQAAPGAVNLQVHVETTTVGRDDMHLSGAVRVTFSATLPQAVHGFNDQAIGCGDHCSFGCPTNHCGLNVPEVPLTTGDIGGCKCGFQDILEAPRILRRGFWVL